MKQTSLSDVFYEAACRMSKHGDPHCEDGTNPYQYSCHAVSVVVNGETDFISSEAHEYEVLMAPNENGWLMVGHVELAAEDIGWNNRDYRTFMLLMAAEAVR